MLVKLYKLLLLACAAALLPGCFAIIAGGAAAGAGVAHDRRSAWTVVNDRNIQLTAFDHINRQKELVRNDNSVKVVVYDGVMLLAGQVHSEELKQLAQKSVADIADVKRIVNEIDVSDDPEGFWRRRQDNTLTLRVKTALLDITSMPGFDPTRVNVTTSHHVVYLMGLVSHEEAEAVAEVARDVGGVEKVVKVFEYSD